MNANHEKPCAFGSRKERSRQFASIRGWTFRSIAPSPGAVGGCLLASVIVALVVNPPHFASTLTFPKASN
jgi:hypothetical protein